MIVLSLFNGMNTGRQALENKGFKVDKYYSSEIKKFAIKLTQYYFPDTIQLGDIRNWKKWNIEWNKIDIVLSGSPCQDLSIAGKRSGINGKNSSLFWIFIDILNYIKSKNSNVLFLQENVASASKKDIGIISRALGIYPVRINSNLLTAQNRDRLYWSNIKIKKEGLFGDFITDISLPKDKKIMLSDIIESGIVRKKKSNTILETYGSSNNYKNIKSEKAQSYFYKKQKQGYSTYVIEILGAAKRGRDGKQKLEINNSGKANCLTTVSKDSMLYEKNEYLRLFTQIELERLQGFPDNYTSILKYNQAASLIGDGWTLPIIEHIFSFLPKKFLK